MPVGSCSRYILKGGGLGRDFNGYKKKIGEVYQGVVSGDLPGPGHPARRLAPLGPHAIPGPLNVAYHVVTVTSDQASGGEILRLRDANG